ncbi:MAG TPA: PilN domain-containing protein [Thermohalobaculum sp.]|nr:PilN domain-containing protein [Thermohalobaculum sp.]
MASALDTRVRQFLRWWGAELRHCLPGGLREALFPTPTRLELVLSRGRVELARFDGRRRELLAEAAADPDRADETVATLRAALGRARADEVVVLLPADKVLEPEFEVPAIAGGALDEVIAQEMDRNTPFGAGEVHFDYNVAGADPSRERLRVRMRVARRSDVAEAVGFARAIGLAPTRVDGAGDTAEAYNLLPLAERARSSRLMPHLLGIAALAALCLGATALYLAFDRAEAELRLVESEVERQRARAAEVRTFQDRTEALKTSATELVEARRSRVTTAELIDELSRRIPDGHWLFEMRYREGELYLFGFSPASTQLLRRLEASPLLSAASFAAPVVAGQEGAERFTIRTEVGPGPAQVDAAQVDPAQGVSAQGDSAQGDSGEVER